jgi:hypothetical protein
MNPEVNQLTSPEVLSLKGLAVAKIQRVFPLRRNSGGAEWLRHIRNDVLSHLEFGPWADRKEVVFLETLSFVYYSRFANIPGEVSVEICKILIEMTLIAAGQEWDEDGKPKHKYDLEADLDVYNNAELLATTSELHYEDCRELAYSILDYAYCLFLTEDNFLGIGAKGTKAGDIVCILFGGKTPFLLRPSGTHYTFMEGCYMHGIMHGEAVAKMENEGLAADWFEIR